MMLSNRLSKLVALQRYQSGALWRAGSRLANLSTAAAGDDNKKPFDKVLIANRGEISQRVIRTCRDLGIATVAIHSTADTKAPFVAEADEAICVGPAAANLSYLNVDAVLAAIQKSGAQAVHPGYGFLSENAAFCNSIQQHGAVFLGPPVHAIQKLGDKIESKILAAESGVTVIPGFDGAVESIEQALQLCNDQIPYPVLLKAAAGGGGKGMRVCYNDQDIKESWGIAKGEALNFFKDDRLLIEKFIEDPHHIEFQVMAAPNKQTGGTDVVVFPERECSIQRRNQKIIEETPSVLLKPETREKMASEVRLLCSAVGYESAGTVEFLVDKNQNYYFLEMNTRLQVEHPVTESITNVDLVKAMLWVGAGWGLPPEMADYTDKVMSFSGHAVEARIYAEDPLRQFLPSTGPLIQYQEPSPALNTPEQYVRVDSGVAMGHVVSPHYDPMLSKVIYRGRNRLEAINGMMQALDEYVVEGVQHNGRLVQSVLREPAFVEGETPTSFLPTHYPDGFQGVQLKPNEKEDFAIAAALISATRHARLGQAPLPASSGDDEEEGVIVRFEGMFGPAFHVVLGETSAKVMALDGESSERTVQLNEIDYEPSSLLAKVTLDGVKRTIQVLGEAATGDMKMQMHGADTNILIQSPREYELAAYMHEPELADTTDLVLSPMPGTLISYAVKPGDEVQPGQELCIVEAMKMQNIIKAPRAGIIAECSVAVGSSLMSDQTILTFEPVEEAAAA